MHKLLKTFIFFILLTSQAFCYELVIVQGISKKKQTFVTRGGKDKSIFVGKNATFTSNDISVIAKAVTVTRNFTQWELKNDYTEIPFRKGEVVTMYNAEEHLWALSPGASHRKYIQSKLFKVKSSLEAHMSFSRGLSESVSQAAATGSERGGFHFDGMYKKELNLYFSYAVGLRFVREIVNTPVASFTNQRFLGIAEGRYYFEPMANFYDARLGLSLGFGYGQSRTETTGQASFGNALLFPSTKLSLDFPINKKYDARLLRSF